MLRWNAELPGDETYTHCVAFPWMTLSHPPTCSDPFAEFLLVSSPGYSQFFSDACWKVAWGPGLFCLKHWHYTSHHSLTDGQAYTFKMAFSSNSSLEGSDAGAVWTEQLPSTVNMLGVNMNDTHLYTHTHTYMHIHIHTHTCIHYY